MADRIAVIKDGILQQVDDPQTLYDHPVNLFVAGFIGSPSMNFFNGTLTGDAQEMYVDTGAFRVRLKADQAAKLADHLGKGVTLGVRPEDIHNPDFLPSGVTGASVSARVELTELMGSEIYVYMVAGENQNFIGRIDPRASYRPGEQAEVIFNLESLHVFDRETEKTLLG